MKRLPSVNAETLRRFADDFFKDMFIECLIEGNVSSKVRMHLFLGAQVLTLVCTLLLKIEACLM